MIDPDSGKEFIFLDMMGNEIDVGDIVFLAESRNSTAVINIALIKEIKFLPKTIEISYSKFSDNRFNERPSYFRRNDADSGSNSRNIVKLKEDISFYLNQPKFARLFVAKKEFESKQGD